ncbi:MAG: OsmC family protein [Thermomicrobiales bacterium]|nr:OsmC family protein [Thermomicrobiales bacterium]
MASVTTTFVPGTAYQTHIETSGLTLTGDEPVASGGDGEGPSPYEFLLAALGHCTVLTMILYARRKAWQIDNVAVRGTFERIVTGDPVAGRTRTERITQEISLSGPLSEDQRARILEIAHKCPVHRTLAKGLEIVTLDASDDIVLVSQQKGRSA